MRSVELANTLIVFTSDNGFMQGEHRVMPDRGKGFAYDPSARIPLVLRGLDLPRGRRVTDVVSNVDLAPTFLALARAVPGRVVDGRSLLPLARDPLADFGRDLLLESGHFLGIRTDRYAYIAYYRRVWELYDLKKDPHQLESLHRDPALRETRLELARRLNDLGTCSGASCLRDPLLRLRLAPAGPSVRADVSGADARWVSGTSYYVDGRRVAADNRSPFGVALPRTLFQGATATVRVRVRTTDGRGVTMTRRIPLR